MAHWEACPTPTIAAVTGGVGHPSLGWCDCSLSRGATMVNPNPVGMADMAEAFEYTAGPLMHWMTRVLRSGYPSGRERNQPKVLCL